MDGELKEWRKKGEHLPTFMRDFHDQKDLFKAVHNLTEHEITERLSWVDAHIYTIDMFLWFMARHGYTLQKSRKKVNFEDINKNIEHCNNERAKTFSALLNKAP